MLYAVTNLELQASRVGVEPLYKAVKSLICCDVASASNQLFASWTACGSLGLVLALVCSIRIVRRTFKKKKADK